MDEHGSRTLTDTIRAALEAGLLEVRTATPARVQSYDAADQRAVVVPLLQRKTATGDLISPGPISDVPVIFQRGGGFAMAFPLAAGDVGLLICSDRSLDRWLDSGGVVDPQSRRHHSMTDAIFLPGLHPWNDPITQTSSSSLLIGAEDGLPLIRMTPDGQVKITATALRAGDPDSVVPLSMATGSASVATELAKIAASIANIATAMNALVPGSVTVIYGTTPSFTVGSTAATKVFGQ